MNSLAEYSEEVSTFFFLNIKVLFFVSMDATYTLQIALSAFSQTAKNFLDGLTANAVIPSDPSIPIKNIITNANLMLPDT